MSNDRDSPLEIGNHIPDMAKMTERILNRFERTLARVPEDKRRLPIVEYPENKNKNTGDRPIVNSVIPTGNTEPEENNK
jgi:hypothetical protein